MHGVGWNDDIAACADVEVATGEVESHGSAHHMKDLVTAVMVKSRVADRTLVVLGDRPVHDPDPPCPILRTHLHVLASRLPRVDHARHGHHLALRRSTRSPQSASYARH